MLEGEPREAASPFSLKVGDGLISVERTPDLGTTRHTGEEFGFFQFGGIPLHGSGVIVLVQKDAKDLTAKPKQHYLLGAAIGTTKAK